MSKKKRSPALPADAVCCMCRELIAGQQILWSRTHRRYAHRSCLLARLRAADTRAAVRARNSRAAATAATAAVESTETAAIRRLMGAARETA